MTGISIGFGNRTLDDDVKLFFGQDQDFSLQYDSNADKFVVTDETNSTEVARFAKNGAGTEILDALDIPIYSNDSNAPNASVYYHDGDTSMKYKDGNGTVHTTDTGLQGGENFDGQSSSVFQQLDTIEVLSQLDIPVYSNDSNAPNNTTYFHDGDTELKHKDTNGSVFGTASGGLSKSDAYFHGGLG